MSRRHRLPEEFGRGENQSEDDLTRFDARYKSDLTGASAMRSWGKGANSPAETAASAA